MLRPICNHRCSLALAALASLVFGACAEAPPARLGRLEVLGAPARSAACEAAGELRLQGFAGSVELVIPGRRAVRRLAAARRAALGGFVADAKGTGTSSHTCLC